MNNSHLFDEWKEVSFWDKISRISGIVSLISFVPAVINWVGKNMSMDSFFTISYIALIVTSATAIYANILMRRKNKDLNQEVIECGEKRKDAVQAVFDFKNKELEDYKKDAEKRAIASRVLIESAMNRDREQFNTRLKILVAIATLASIAGISMAAPLCNIGSEANVAGFIEKEDLEKFRQFIYDEDYDAGDLFLMQLIAIGQATLLKKGETVYVEDSGGFIGDKQVRRPGEIESYWILRNAVECPE